MAGLPRRRCASMNDRMQTPRVSVIVPCYNERRFVAPSLRSLLDGSFAPTQMEVLVVDGGSTDGTREILRDLARDDARLRLIDNPRRTTPVALNLGIAAARGEIIVRADAHTLYPRDYLEVLTRALVETGADLVGCPADPTPGADTWMARLIVLASRGLFATGSPFRNRRSSGAVDTVPFGCWRRSLFDRVGLFDERLLRNQDNEHASRILRAGGRVYLTAETRVGTVLRSTLGELWGHAATGGMWNAFTHRLHPYTFRWRHFLPGVFFIGVLLAASVIVAGLWSGRAAIAALGVAALAPYVAANLWTSLHKAIQERQLVLAAPIALVTASYHFTYGYGIAKGWLLVASGRWRDRLGHQGRS
jgi:glycosyltransferase involved in cell wall biosynthesis